MQRLQLDFNITKYWDIKGIAYDVIFTIVP